MNKRSESTSAVVGLRGAAVGGIIGITVWQGVSGSLFGLGFFVGLGVLTLYMAACSLLGMAIERSMLRRFSPIDKGSN